MDPSFRPRNVAVQWPQRCSVVREMLCGLLGLAAVVASAAAAAGAMPIAQGAAQTVVAAPGTPPPLHASLLPPPPPSSRRRTRRAAAVAAAAAHRHTAATHPPPPPRSRVGRGSLGAFEHEVRLQAKRLAQQQHRDASPIDVRVSKGVGSRGYDVARVSVISQGAAAAAAAAEDLRRLDPDAYNDTFQYRWRGAFDLGSAATSCGPAAVYNHTTGVDGPGGYDADCMEACTRDYPRCKFYTCVRMRRVKYAMRPS
jgi:hypothetical protein